MKSIIALALVACTMAGFAVVPAYPGYGYGYAPAPAYVAPSFGFYYRGYYGHRHW